MSISELRFTGQSHHLSVLLCWSAEAALGVQRFIVERSEDGVNWERIGSVQQPASNGSFSYWDTSVWPGKSYAYRLSLPTASGALMRSDELRVEVDSCMDEALLAALLVGLIGWFTRIAKRVL